MSAGTCRPRPTSTCWSSRSLKRFAPGKNIEELCRVEGVELFQFGPADYSSTAGYKGQWEGPGVAEQLLAIKETIRRHGKHCGVLATSNENLAQRRDQGFRFLGVGMDAGLLLRSLTGALEEMGRSTSIFDRLRRLSAKPASVTATASGDWDLSHRPAERAVAAPRDASGEYSSRPAGSDHNAERGANGSSSSGASFFSRTSGAHNQARNLTTGIVTFMPGAQLPYHTHPHGEAITLLSGEAEVEVEGRRYRLRPLDNVYIPRRTGAFRSQPVGQQTGHVPHRDEQPRAVANAGSGTVTPTRMMPDDAAGVAGAERVSRHASTPWYEPNPGACFQDYFNRDLGSVGMSGGYGEFTPGGRLPCHLHDFDESITIVQGTATCVVEGRRYALSDCATALAPRGRCHYFINLTDRPMAMIWVYAGDLPQRLVLSEQCCLPEGCPEQTRDQTKPTTTRFASPLPATFRMPRASRNTTISGWAYFTTQRHIEHRIIAETSPELTPDQIGRRERRDRADAAGDAAEFAPTARSAGDCPLRGRLRQR